MRPYLLLCRVCFCSGHGALKLEPVCLLCNIFSFNIALSFSELVNMTFINANTSIIQLIISALYCRTKLFYVKDFNAEKVINVEEKEKPSCAVNTKNGVSSLSMKVLSEMYRNMELKFSAMPNIIYLLSTVMLLQQLGVKLLTYFLITAKRILNVNCFLNVLDSVRVFVKL